MSKTTDTSRVTVIGLGNMGSALAEALVGAGHAVTVWNRTRAKCLPLGERGAEIAASAADAARASALTIVCVSDHAATVSIVHNDDMAQALRGKTLAQLSTITAELSSKTAGWAKENDIAYLEGSILGLPSDIRDSLATLVCSGPRNVFDAHRSTLVALGGNPQHVSEETGSAYNFDKVIFAFVYGMTHSFLQGAALAEASGFSLDAYTGVACGRLPSFVEKFKANGDMLVRRNYDDVQCTIEVHADAFAEVVALCRTLGVDDALPAVVMRNFQRAMDAGHGQREIPAVFEVLKSRQG